MRVTFAPTDGTPLTLGPEPSSRGAIGIWLIREEHPLFPIPGYDEVYAESGDTEGARRVRSRPQNPTASGTVIVSGDTEEVFQSYLDLWQSNIEAIRLDGGTLEYALSDTSQVITADIESMHVAEAPYDGIALGGYVQGFVFEATCRPYGRLDSQAVDLQIADSFAQDSITAEDWTFDAGTGTLSVSGGQLVPSSTAEKRLYRSGVLSEDGSVTFKFTTAATVTGINAGVILKRIDTNNWLEARVTNSALAIYKSDGGAVSQLATSAYTLATATSYWLRFVVAGAVLTATLYLTNPDSGGTAAATTTYTLAGADAAKYGTGILGGSGLRLVPASTDERYDDWRAGVSYVRSSLPLLAVEIPNVPGHVSALGDLTLTEASTVTREHVEIGLEPGLTYNKEADPPSLLDSTAMSGTSASRSGAYKGNVRRATVTTTPATVCSFSGLKHVGHYRVKVRVFAASLFYARLVWADGDGPLTRNGWVPVASTGHFMEMDLGLITVTKAMLGSQTWRGYVEARAATGSVAVDVDYAMFFGGGGYAKSRWPNNHPDGAASNAVLWSGRSARFRSGDALRQSSDGLTWGSAPYFEGKRLRIPAAGPRNLTSRLVIKARRLDVDQTYDDNIGDTIQASLTVTPRVILL